MTQLFTTPRGTILIRSANRTDVSQFRELRLHGLQNSPTAFSADYQTNLSQPSQYWEDRLKMNEDEVTILFAEHEANLVGMTGIGLGSSPKTKHNAWIWSV